jgi:hypothetical protein
MPQTRTTVAAAVFGCVACGAGLLDPSALGQIGIKEINANRDAYVGQTVSVDGRIHVEEYRSLEPCGAGEPRCGWPIATTLHVVVPGETRNNSNSVDLYELSLGGGYVPARCRIVSNTLFDCGSLTKDAVASVQGRFVKERQPTQTVGPSSGPPQVLLYKDVYFLVDKRYKKSRQHRLAALLMSVVVRYLTCTTRVLVLLAGRGSIVELATSAVLLMGPLLPLTRR